MGLSSSLKALKLEMCMKIMMRRERLAFQGEKSLVEDGSKRRPMSDNR
jgi:hypothetical protein